MTADEKLDRLQAQVSEIREMLLMQLAVLQVVAIKVGAGPKEWQGLSPVPVPTPMDIQDMLKPRDQAAGL